jgi:uroporphyrinogen-III synthase
VGLMPVHPRQGRLGALVRTVVLDLAERVSAIETPAGVLRIRASAATLDHRPLSLSPSGLAVLRRLAREPGRVVTREHLLHALPGGSRDPHAAEVAVARLRDALGPHQLVRTIMKRGYVLQTV